MSDKKYWQNFEDFNQSDSEQKALKNEFNEELPFEELANENIFNATTPRRDFLKYMGFSTAAAALAASCEMPVRKAIPYLNKPDDMLPGIANYYASTYINDGDAIPVVVKQREGRPIKIEGNDLSSLTDGGTSARCQSSVLDLYDTTRLRYPMANGKEATFEVIDKMIATNMATNAGKQTVLLTSSITSPTTKQIIAELAAKFPGSLKHVQYDAVSYSGLIIGNEASYGKRGIPAYHFENAKVIVSIGADFLATWLSPVVFAKQYAQTRRIVQDKPALSKHYQFESHYSITGANADERFLHKPSETGAVALALLGALKGGSAAGITGRTAEGIKKAAADLSANKGAALVVCGSNDVNVQILVNAINEELGAGGKTIDWSTPVNYRQGVDADIIALTNDLNSGNVRTLLVYGANPVYSYLDAAKFAAGLKKCPLTISYSEKMDETTELCKYVIPSHHWLECWGDAEPQKGYVSVLQPLIHPLFKTRQFEDSLLVLTGNTKDYETYFREYWISKLGSLENYERFVQDGVLETTNSKGLGSLVNPFTLTSATAARSASFNSADSVSQKMPATVETSNSDSTSVPGGALPSSQMGSSTFTGNIADATAKIGGTKGSDIEVVLYEKVSLGTGNRANNAWLQEVSDPISKATWDNYAMISPQMGKSLFGIDVWNRRDSDKYEVSIEKPTIKITVNGKTIILPVLIIPGTHPNVIAMAVGYGRKSNNADKTSEFIGAAANGVGVNVYPLASFNGTTIIYSAPATIEKTGDTFPIAQTQVHNITEGRPIVRETSLAEFISHPDKMIKEEEEE
ncbi:MAG: TAT-variant-translocated molybdopterin oxidoreductase, partial [Ginsengibacter sp.]